MKIGAILHAAADTLADPIEILPLEVRAAYVALRVLPDGRICGVRRLAYHWTMHVDIDPWGIAERYCFAERWMAESALATWDGTGDPLPLWHRHPTTGRRRDISTGREWVAW